MKRETLSKAVGDIRTDYIEEAADARLPAKQNTALRRWLPLAACLVLVLTAGAVILNHSNAYEECAPQAPEAAESPDMSDAVDSALGNESSEPPKSCFLLPKNPLQFVPNPLENLGMVDLGEAESVGAEELADYYGVSLPLSPLLSEYGLSLKEEEHYLYQKDGTVFLDQNRFLYEGDGCTVSVGLSREGTMLLPSYALSTDLPKTLEFTDFNGRKLAVFSYEESGTEHLYLEWKQAGLCWRLDAAGLPQNEFLALVYDLLLPAEEPAEIHSFTGTVTVSDPGAELLALTSEDGEHLSLQMGDLTPPDAFGKTFTVTYRGEPALLETLLAPQIISLTQ